MKSKACHKIQLFVAFYSFTSFRQEQSSNLHNRDHEASHQISVLSFDSEIKNYYSLTEIVSGKMSLTKVKKLVFKFNCELCFRLLFNLWLAQITLIEFRSLHLKKRYQQKMKHMNHQNMNQSQVIAVLKMNARFYLRPQNENFFKRI